MDLKTRPGLLKLWLPLFLVLSVSWLFGPGLHHDHGASLHLISHYESHGQPLGRLFRVCDFLAASLLAWATWYYVRRKSTLYASFLFAIAALSIIDIVFPSSRSHSGWHEVSNIVHTTESIAVVVLTALLSCIDAFRRKQAATLWFIAVQAGCASAALFGLHNSAILYGSQYVYQVGVFVWLAWLVYTFDGTGTVSQRLHAPLRRLFGYWTALNGTLLIAVSVLHAQQRYPLLQRVGEEYGWVTQHGVVAGVLMLYLARHLWLGQRRAAIFIGALLGTQVIIYSIIRPTAIVLAVALVSCALLAFSASAFTRNLEPLRYTSRLADAAVVFSGVVLAIGLLFAVVAASGEQYHFQHVVQRAYATDAVTDVKGRLSSEEASLDRSAAHVRRVGGTLVAAVGLTLLWSLFRPASLRRSTASEADKKLADKILARHSRSSEDFFKLWPADKHYFFSPGNTGFVAYKVSGGIAFALADPIGSPQVRQTLLTTFSEYCHKRGWSVCFLGVEEASKHHYEPTLKLMRAGSSAVIDIDTFQNETVRNKWWRWQKNRADRLGYRYETSLPPHSTTLLGETRKLSDHWLQRNHHQEQSFALGYYQTGYLQKCRLHLLRDANGQLVAFANQLPPYNHNPQTTVDLIRFLPEADGAMPVLIMYIMEQLHEEGAFQRFDLGFVPLAKVDTPIAKLARRLAASRFSAAGLEQFKGKFQPDWQPSYIAYDGDLLTLPVILANLESVLKVP